jgi:hypothetical protein
VCTPLPKACLLFPDLGVLEEAVPPIGGEEQEAIPLSLLHSTTEARVVQEPPWDQKQPMASTLVRDDFVTYLGKATAMNSDCSEQSF